MDPSSSLLTEVLRAQSERRSFLKGAGAGLLAATLAGPRLAAAGTPTEPPRLGKLTDLQGLTLDALGDTLLPGAAAAGISRYVDAQLASAEPLLLLKYVDFPVDSTDFYRQSLDALEQHSQNTHQQAFHALAMDDRTAMVGQIAQQQPDGWNAPPSQLFYFIARNDAVDVCYGTEDGFAKLGVPYMAHIAPPRPW